VQRATLFIYPLAPGLLMLAVVTGITSVRLSLTAFRQQRIVDEDTGLRNKRAMLHGDRVAAQSHVVVADLANFDSVAAVMGQESLNDIIRRTADRLRLIAREQRVYKVGDRLLAFHLLTDANLDEVISGLRNILQQPIDVMGRKIDMAITLGVSRSDASGLEMALSRATMAAEKAAGQGRFWLEADADLSELDLSISLMAELDEAMENGDIIPYYQPKLSLATNRIVSVEALARWQHPVRGMIRPDDFILLAERTGRIAKLTEYMLRQVIRDVSLWRAAGHEITAAVNISAKLVTNAAFKEHVLALLAGSAIPNSSLIFEVTESAALDDPEAAAVALAEFRDRGVTISMDDYGTGQSSLSYLRKLPLAELKIDRSFVENAHRNRNDAVMVRSTISLAHDLGLKVVAEGVEEQACLAFLRSVDCDIAQGYLISRPVPRSQIEELFEKSFDMDVAA
jgi:EAL domain-containing protein (putative c-di-GMP-specific phosphodiesterase class I)/GGDEF domain-containing protein